MNDSLNAKTALIKVFYTIDEDARDKKFANTVDFLRYRIAEIMSRDVSKDPLDKEEYSDID